MREKDFAIHARVRRALARRWVRADRLEIGTTEGVVLLKGRLETEPGDRADSAGNEAWGRFVQDLSRELRAIPGVVDVVLEIRPAGKDG